MPVSNFANEMLEIWKIGCTKSIPIEFKSEAKAIRFRFRMYMLRKDMRVENHHLLPFAEKCMIKVDKNKVVVCPVDDDFANILRQHGIIVDIENPNIFGNPEEDTDADSEAQKAVEAWRNNTIGDTDTQ
jgi:hypothetical protein